MAVVTPIPSPSDITTTRLNSGAFVRLGNANRIRPMAGLLPGSVVRRRGPENRWQSAEELAPPPNRPFVTVWLVHRFLALLTIAVGCCAQPAAPCYAFLLKGDISTVCQGKAAVITHRGDVASFAVSDEQATLAYVTGKSAAATVVNLKTGASKRFENVDGVVSSCGSIQPIPLASTATTRDLITGGELSFAPYSRFRCSADRRVVAGITQHDLYLGVPPAAKMAAAGDVDDLYFNVSPDGSKVAWFNSVRPLCVAAPPAKAQCVDHETMSDPVSVNDAGELLAAAGTGKGCDYKTAYNFSPARQANGGDDECLGIGYWKPGIPAIVFLQEIGRNPQWLKPETAKLLADWARLPKAK